MRVDEVGPGDVHDVGSESGQQFGAHRAGNHVSHIHNSNAIQRRPFSWCGEGFGVGVVDAFQVDDRSSRDVDAHRRRGPLFGGSCCGRNAARRNEGTNYTLTIGG